MLSSWQSVPCVVIGMLHLPALPGSPLYGDNWPSIATAMLRDAETLVSGGVHGLIIENFGDTPFFKTQVPGHTIAHMTAVALQVKQKFANVPLGIYCLRNDGCSAVAIAAAVGADYVRVNVLSGARVTDQGVIEGVAADMLRLRRQLGARHIKILADVDVKHSAPLGAGVALEDEVDDVVHRGGAEGLVVSGAGTGKATDVTKAARVHKAAKGVPVFIGSGVTAESLASFKPHVKGVIVGTYFKENGSVDRPVEASRVKALMDIAR